MLDVGPLLSKIGPRIGSRGAATESSPERELREAGNQTDQAPEGRQKVTDWQCGKPTQNRLSPRRGSDIHSDQVPGACAPG